MEYRNSPPPTAGAAGFGTIDALVALALLGITLLGACGSVHFALRATRAAGWQARAVDLLADLDEDLQQAADREPAPALAEWQARLGRELPGGRILSVVPRRMDAGPGLEFSELQLAWNGMPGQRAETLQMPLAQRAHP